MLFYKSEYFENTDMRIINLWSTQYGAERADHNQLFGYRIQDACDKFGVKNSLALFAYAATISQWYSKAPRDRARQVEWCEDLAEQFSKLDDIRLMPMTEDQQVIMTLVWTQATTRLNEYAKFKKPQEPKLPTKIEPIPEQPKKNQEPSQPERSDKEEFPKVEEPKKSGTMKVIGSIATVLALIVAWLPIPPQFKAIAKVVLNAIASIFR